MIKDEEYLKSKASFCLDLAKKFGATDAIVTVGNSISETVSFRNKVLDESNRSDSLAISIETLNICRLVPSVRSKPTSGLSRRQTRICII